MLPSSPFSILLDIYSALLYDSYLSEIGRLLKLSPTALTAIAVLRALALTVMPTMSPSTVPSVVHNIL